MTIVTEKHCQAGCSRRNRFFSWWVGFSVVFILLSVCVSSVRADDLGVVVASVQARDSRSLVISTKANLPVGDDWNNQEDTNLLPESYTLSNGLAVRSVVQEDSLHLVLKLNGDLEPGVAVTISCTNLYLKEPGNSSYARWSGQLTLGVPSLLRSGLCAMPIVWGRDDGSGKLDTNGVSDVVAVVAGDDFTGYLSYDGTVICKGTNAYSSVASWTDMVAIAGCGKSLAGLKADGTVCVAGAIASTIGAKDSTLISNGVITATGWTNIKKIAVCNQVLVGLGEDGKIKRIGGLAVDDIVNLDDHVNVVDLSVNEGSIAILDGNGTLEWVSNDVYVGETQQHSSMNEVALVASGIGNMVCLKTDGTLTVKIRSIYQSYGLEDISGIDGSKVEMISTANSHTLYLVDGEVKIKGSKTNGSNVVEWTEYPEGLSESQRRIIAVAAGMRHSVALVSSEVEVASEEESELHQSFSINEGELWAHEIVIPALDGKTVAYSLLAESLPEGMIFNQNAGALYWQTDEEDGPGVYTVRIRAADVEDLNSFVDVFITIEVAEVNQSPQVYANDVMVSAGMSVDLVVLAEDLDLPANALSFSLTEAPDGMSIDSETGRISWNTDNADVGTHSVVVAVSDSFVPTAGSARVSFNVQVVEAEVPLAFSEIENQNLLELVPWTQRLQATGGGGSYVWTLLSGPPGMSLSGSTLGWTPSEEQGNGTAYAVTVQVGDGNSLVAESFILSVAEVNANPVIAAIPDQSARVGETFTLQVVGTDSDNPANALAYTFENEVPLGMRMDPATGLIRCEIKKEIYQESPYTIHVMVSDGFGGVARRSFTLSIVYVNNPPVVVGETSELSIPEGRLSSLTSLLGWSFSDSDDNDLGLLFELKEGAPEGMSVDANGAISWTPTEEQGPGNYKASLVVRDSDPVAPQSVEREFSVTVTEVNAAPVFGAIADQSVQVGETFSLQVRATDSDIPKQRLTYSLQGDPPTGCTFYSTGDLVWAPTLAQVGEYTFNLVATDNGTPAARGTGTVKITVTEPPPATLLFLPVGNLSIQEHSLFQVTLVATAIGNVGAIQYSLLESPTGMSLDAGTGRLMWVTEENDGGRNFTVRVKATESVAPRREAELSFRVSVEEVNDLPVIQPIELQTVDEEVRLQVDVVASDPEGQALTYQVVSIEPSAFVEAGDATFSGNQFNWTPREVHGPGAYTVTFRVSDSEGAWIESRFRVLVRAVNTPPRLTSAKSFNAYAGREFSETLRAEDDDLPLEKIVFTKTSGPEDLTIHPHTGQIQWLVPLNFSLGVTTVGVQITDVNAGGVTENITIQVRSWGEVEPSSGMVELASRLKEGEPFEFCLHTPGTEGKEWRLLSSPKGMSFDPESALISWVPGELDGGAVREVLAEAVGGKRQGSLQRVKMSLSVIEMNSPPQIECPPIPAFRLNQEIRFCVKVSDPDIPVQKLHLALLSPLPTGANFDSDTGEFTWRPTSKKDFTESDCSLHLRVIDSGAPLYQSETEVLLSLLENEAGDEPTLQYDYQPSQGAGAGEELLLSWALQDEVEYLIYSATADPLKEWKLFGKIFCHSDFLIFESALETQKSGWLCLENEAGEKQSIYSKEMVNDGFLRIQWSRDPADPLSTIKTTSDILEMDWMPLIQMDHQDHRILFHGRLGEGVDGVRNFRVEPQTQSF